MTARRRCAAKTNAFTVLFNEMLQRGRDRRSGCNRHVLEARDILEFYKSLGTNTAPNRLKAATLRTETA